MYEVKNSKICNFWTFWPVIQLIKELSTKISRSAVFASCIAGILKKYEGTAYFKRPIKGTTINDLEKNLKGHPQEKNFKRPRRGK